MIMAMAEFPEIAPPIVCVLSAQEAITAAMVGARRQVYAMTNGLRNYGSDDNETPFDHHIFGAMSEFIVAREFNLFWHPNVGNIEGADVGGILDVRLRYHPGGTGSDLAIRPHDKDDKPYLLVHSDRSLRFRLIGWLWGSEGKEAGPWNDHRKVWFVSPPYRPLDELREYVELCR